MNFKTSLSNCNLNNDRTLVYGYKYTNLSYNRTQLHQLILSKAKSPPIKHDITTSIYFGFSYALSQ